MSHPLADGYPPTWARSWGEHRLYGVWAAFEVQGADGGVVQQRMRWIPAGRFWMGSAADDGERFNDEEPQHEVKISRGFWLGETPCTQALWSAVTGDNPSHFKGERRPVERVTVAMAEAFLAKLNARFSSGDQRLGEGPFRLPYEAEWEYACRASSETVRYRLPEENREAKLGEVAWYAGNSQQDTSDGELQTHDVGLKRPNAFGLFDMLGNVWEWCADEMRDYESSSELLVDPFVPARKDAERVVRGGSWRFDARLVRCAYRFANPPVVDWGDRGFRLARGPEPA